MIGGSNPQPSRSAITILQTAAEAYLVSHFEDAGLCAIQVR